MRFLWLQIVITKYTGQSLKRVECVRRTCRTNTKKIFTRFWNNFDFVPSMIYDIKIIIWHILFIAKVFEWTENPSLLEMSVRHENGWLYGFYWRVKERLIFPSKNYEKVKKACICLQLPCQLIFFNDIIYFKQLKMHLLCH